MVVNWISFFDRQPEDGQKIWYYGKYIGVWVGIYHYSPNDPVSPHIIVCDEAPGVVDRMDAPWWMSYRPNKPATDYPEDYPS
jgi:hypothetical protein